MTVSSAARSGIPLLSLVPEQVDQLYCLDDLFPDGCNVQLSEGEYLVTKTVRLPSNTSITGKGRGKTILVLGEGANCHLFTNSSHAEGNVNIAFSDFSVEGNGDHQQRPANHRALTFCCGVYLKRVSGARLKNCAFHDIRQTAAHFSECMHVSVEGMTARRLGWSGVSTSGTSDLRVQVVVSDAGRDVMHSAIHIDGGIGNYVEAAVSDTSGNGIMLDSAYAPLLNSVAKGSAMNCKRGLSLSGSGVHPLSNVYIEGAFDANAEVGIMVSNANSVVIAHSRACNNGVAGIRFQGRNGGTDCLVVDTEVRDNPTNFEHMHESKDNWVFPCSGISDDAASINQRMLAGLQDKRNTAQR